MWKHMTGIFDRYYAVTGNNKLLPVSFLSGTLHLDSLP